MADNNNEISAPSAKQRSPIEKMLVWGGIAVLAGVVFIEYRAQRANQAAMTWLEENENKQPTLDEVRAALSGASETPFEDREDAIAFNWFSLFKSKDYEVVCETKIKEETVVMTGYYQPGLLAEVQADLAESAKELAEAAAASAAKPGDGSSGGGMPAPRDNIISPSSHDAEGGGGGPGGPPAETTPGGADEKQRPELEGDAPAADTPAGDSPAGGSPAADAPAADAPAADAPAADAPAADAPAGDSPAADAPKTEE